MRPSAPFTAASAASTQATRPRVSIIPRAFMFWVLSLRDVHDVAGLDPGGVRLVGVHVELEAVLVRYSHDDVFENDGAPRAGPGAHAHDLAGRHAGGLRLGRREMNVTLGDDDALFDL